MYIFDAGARETRGEREGRVGTIDCVVHVRNSGNFPTMSKSVPELLREAAAALERQQNQPQTAGFDSSLSPTTSSTTTTTPSAPDRSNARGKISS